MSDKDSRTEDPTGKKLAEARKKGQIARSQDLVQWTSVFIGCSILGRVISKGSDFLVGNLNEAAQLMAQPDPNKALAFMGQSVMHAFIIVAPIALVFMIAGVGGHLAQVRFVFSTESIKPNLNKLNPMTGIKRLFSKQSTFEAGKQLVKTVVLGVLVYMTIYKTMTTLSASGPYDTRQLWTMITGTAIKFVREVAMVGIVIGIIDYFMARRRTKGQLKMTKHEVKEEAKQQDLPAEVRGKIRQKQRQLSRNRMMAAIKDADVVVVNPVHIAMALKYDAERGAPRVVAKGAGFVAEKIREKAEEAHIPMIQDIPLARAMYKACDIDDEIPNEMFQAVAKLLAFVFALRGRGGSSGITKMPGTPDLEDAGEWKDAPAALVPA